MIDSPNPPADEDLVFICGALRSGTTLLRLMINDHPQLSNPGEMDFLFEPPPMREGRRDMAAYARKLAFNRVVAKLDLKLVPGLDYCEQVAEFIRQLRKPGRLLTINVHRHFDRIPGLFPAARYVHLLRDPRDVARSSIGMGWAGNVYHGVDHWIASERDFERLAAAVGEGRIHRMKNEDLVRAPARELTKMCAFLGVGYDARMLDYPSHTTYGPPDPGLVEQWRRDQSPREIGLVEAKVGPMLAARGYAESGFSAVRPGAFGRLALRFDDRLGRWRDSARRYGLMLTIAEMASARLRLPALTAFVQRRKAPINARYLK